MADKTTTATGGLDSSIPLGIKTPEPLNLLGMAAQAQQLQNAANQNRLFQAQQAGAQAYQSAIDPTTGQFSPQAANMALANSPDAALAVPGLLTQGQAQGASQFDLAKKKQQYFGQAALELLLKHPDGNIPAAELHGILDHETAVGLMTPQERDATKAQFGSDTASNGTKVRQYAVANLSAQGAVDATTPGVGIQETGRGPQGFTQAPRLAPNAGAITPAGGVTVPSGLPSPASMTEIVRITMPDGSVVPMTRGDVLKQLGVDPNNPTGTNPLGTGRPPPSTLVGPGGTPAPSGAPPAAPPSAGPAAPPVPIGPPPSVGAGAPNGGGLVLEQGPAKTAAQTATGADSAKHFQDVSAQGQQALGQSAILSNMLTDAAQFSQGPGQENIKAFQSQLQRFAPGIATAFGIKPDSIAANESFDKFANQLANAQGAGSDARLAVNQGANPSSHLTPAGVDLVLRQLQGNADFLKAKQAVAASYPDKTDSQGFEAQVSKTLDPRYFQFARMTRDQQASYLDGLKKKGGLGTFIRGYSDLHDGPNGSLLQTGQ